jgi:hypothetical protein
VADVAEDATAAAEPVTRDVHDAQAAADGPAPVAGAAAGLASDAADLASDAPVPDGAAGIADHAAALADHVAALDDHNVGPAERAAGDRQSDRAAARNEALSGAERT